MSEMTDLKRKMFKKTFKKALFTVAYYSGALHILIFVLTKLRKQHCAAILFYHRFSRASFDFDQLPHLDIGEFEKQMRHIKKWYSVITMDELADKLAEKTHFALPYIVITIDDGYLNNYTMAYPVLKALGLPATIYLTTGFIGTNKAPWVDDLGYMLSLTEKKSLQHPGILNGQVLDISNSGSKARALDKLFEALLHLRHKEKINAMAELSRELGLNDILKVSGQRKMVNWNEVIEMSRNKISFGAHTVSHPTLSKMGLPEAMQEIYESKMEIETRVGRKVRHFAIPNGKAEDFSDELKTYCKEIGMSTVVSTEPGPVHDKSDPYFLKRISPVPQIYIFACELARYIFLKRVRKSDRPGRRRDSC